MVFCGQCGLQLAPGATHCPRCGTPVEGDVVVEEYYADGPTVASFPYMAQTPPQPGKSNSAGTVSLNNPQKLMPDADIQSTLGANAPTSRIDASTYDTRISRPPSNPNMGTPYTGYPSSGNYSPQVTAHPGYGSPSGGDYSTQEASYPGVLPGSMGYASPSSPYHAGQQSHRAKGRVVSLVIILFGLLLILGAMVVFALKQNGFISGTNGNPASGGGNTLSQQAPALIQRYYNDVNNKDYQNAYNLWKDNPHWQSFAAFSQGYAHTQHDDITIDNVTTLSDGTAKGFVTINATEDASSGTGTQNRVYKGYYIVGPQNGVLKILSGQLNQVS